MSHSRTSLFVLLFSLAALPFAQAADTVPGTVKDSSGAVLPGVTVRVLDTAGTETAKAVTDGRGHFEVEASGNCRVEALLQGFKTATVSCSAKHPFQIVLSVNTRGMSIDCVNGCHEETFVTATATPVPPENVGASVSVFTAEDLRARREPYVADLLRSTPGAMVIRTGAPGGVTSLFVRGGESNYNKVLIDGIPVNEPGGTFNFGNLTTDNLDRIEVVRGAHSALYGSDAMASVVQLFTRSHDPLNLSGRPEVTAGIEGGTFGTYNATAAVTGATDKVNYMLGGSRFATDNSGVNNKTGNNSLTLNGGWNIGHGAILRALGRAEFQHSGTPGQTAIKAADKDAFFERHDGQGGLTFDQQVGDSFHEHAVYSYGVSNQVSSNLIADSSSDFTYDSTTNLRRHYASYQADITMPRMANANHLLTVLADWNGERIHLVDRMPFDPGDADSKHSRNNFGAAIEEQASWRRAFLTVGGRVEHNQNFGTVAVPRGSLVIVAHEKGDGTFGETRVHVSGGMGIKEPTALQSFSKNAFFKGNPDLKPERSDSYEVGVDQRFADNRAKVEATWFDNRFKDQITLVNSQYVNINKTRAKGVELGIDLAPVRMLHVNGGYTFVDSSTPLLRRPRNTGTVGATLTHSRFTANINGVFVGQFADNDFAFPVARTLNPGYKLVNGRVSVKITKHLELVGSLDNAGDASYEEPLGYPGLGRAARLGVQVKF